MSRFLSRVTLAAFVCLANMLGAAAQPLDEHCLVNLLNHSARVNANGTWSIPNLPEEPGLFRVRATCIWNGETVNGMSGFFALSDDAALSNVVISFDEYVPPPVTLRMAIMDSELTMEGETTRAVVTAEEPGGKLRNVTPEGSGTFFSSSNEAIASVDQGGVVTAHRRGTAIIQARYEGRLVAASLRVLIAEDDDSDLMSNAFEALYDFDSADPSDATLDSDFDTLSNRMEFDIGTNPRQVDTDGDEVGDGEELALGTSPLSPDTDLDSLIDGKELALGTDPLLADTDGDALADGIELQLGLDPLAADLSTAVSGNVVDANNAPVIGAAVSIYGQLFAFTDASGAFVFPAVPQLAASALVVSAQLVADGTVRKASTAELTPNLGAATSAGTLTLVQVLGAVGGVVRSPAGTVVQGVSVTVASGPDVRMTVTDPTGAYAVDQLDAGPVVVECTDPATGLRAQATGTLAVDAAAIVDVTLSPSGTVRGKVFAADGVTPVGPGVSVDVSGALFASADTDVFGEYRFGYLPLGAYTVDVADLSGNRARTVANLNSTNQVFNANLAFLGRGTVVGVVETATGQRVEGAQVSLRSRSLFGGNQSAVSGPMGQFQFEQVFVGPFEVEVSDPESGLGGFVSEQLSTHGAFADVTVVLTPSGTLTGTVRESDGLTAAPGVEVVLYPSAKSAITDENGSYSIPAVPLGAYLAIATKLANGDEGQAAVSIEAPDTSTTVDIVLNGVGAVDVTVVDGGGAPVPGAQILVSGDGAFGGSWTATADSTGRATVSDVRAGAFSVSASSPLAQLGGSAASTLLPNETVSVTVQLEASGVITGTVYASDGTTPASNVDVKLAPGNRIAKTGTNGVYFFDYVALSKGPFGLEAFDSQGTRRATHSGTTLSSQGQVQIVDLVLSGQGTVNGAVLNPDGSPSAGTVVVLQSAAVGASNISTTSSATGAYQFAAVPEGPFQLVANNSALQLGGSAAGTIAFHGDVEAVDIQLFANQIAPPPAPPSPGSPNFSPVVGSPSLSLFDANNFSYPIRSSGVLADGSQSVFAGDAAANRGSDQLYLVSGAGAELFFAEEAALELTGRQVRLSATAVETGLSVTRQVYVPREGYFARFLETIHNPTGDPITVSIRLEHDYRSRPAPFGPFAAVTGQTVVSTASGDAFFGGPASDSWLVLDDNTDVDPFLEPNLQALAHVYGDSAAALGNQSYDPAFSGDSRAHVESSYVEVTLPPGGSVAYLHFTVQQLSRAAAIAAAERLASLPPEALFGLTQQERDLIVNFAVPTDGVGTVEPLPALNGAVSGLVLEADGSTVVPSTGVRFRSEHPLFGRTQLTGAGLDGAFALAAQFNDHGNSVAIPLFDFVLDATHPVSGQAATQTQGTFIGSLDPSTSADVIFGGTGWVVGTVRRTDGTVVSHGTVELSTDGLLYKLTTPIGADGGFGFYGLPTGVATLIASLPVPDGTALQGGASAAIVAGQGAVRDITIEPAGTVTGHVVDGGGAPAVGVLVFLAGPDGFTRNKTTDTGGAFTFIDAPVGALTLTALEPQTAIPVSAQIAVVQDTTTTQNFQLIGVGSLLVQALYSDGSPGANVPVQVLMAPKGPFYEGHGATNFAGVRLVTGVPAGNFTVRVANPQNNALVATASGTVTAHGQQVLVPITIPIDQPPTVALTQPGAGLVVTENSTIVATALTTDDLGVSRVDFYVDGVFAATDGLSPFSAGVQVQMPLSGNEVVITAVAVDSGNNATLSAPVVVTVQPDAAPPAVALFAPEDGATIVEGTAFVAAAVAGDDVGIAQVAFQFGQDPPVADSTVGYDVEFEVPQDFTAGAGGPVAVAVTATATDLAGNTAVSTRTVTILPDAPPSIALVSAPADGATVIEGTQGTFEVDITDDVGAQAELVIDGAVAQVRTKSPYVFLYTYPDVASAGSIEVTLRARDTKGQVTALPSLDITVVQDLPPTIAFVSPDEGADFVEGTDVPIVVTANDDLGIESVQFYAEGQLVATDTSAPYSTTWRMSSGEDETNVMLEAVALDTQGKRATASRQVLRLDDNIAPTQVVVTSPADDAVVSVGMSDVIIVVDTSGSTSASAGADIDGDGLDDNILKAEVLAAKQLLPFLDPDRTRVGVVRFSSGAFLSQALTGDFALVDAALDAILATGSSGGTNFDAAVQVATEQLIGPGANSEALPVQIFMSDGEAGFPAGLVQTAADGGIVINTFAVGEDASTEVLQQIADATGGTMTPVVNPAELVDVFPSILLFGVDGVLAAATATDNIAVRNVEFRLQAADNSFNVISNDEAELWIRLLNIPPIEAAVQATVTATAFDYGDNTVVSDPVNITILPAAIQPKLSVLEPAFGVAGQPVTLRGKFFSSVPAENVVLFNGVEAVVTGASKIALEVVVPVGVTTGPVSVEVLGITSNALVFVLDSDADGLSDEQEASLGTDPNQADTDGDGLSDSAELNLHTTDPLVADTDGDGMPDGFEVTYGFDPKHVGDGSFDADSDSLTNAQEFSLATNPIDADSDDDGLLDGAEVNTHLTDPLVFDTDGGGVGDGFEVAYGLDPHLSADDTEDGDNDGLDNVQEQLAGSDPFDSDTDGDTLLDGDEVAAGTSPAKADTDNDGLADNLEVVTDPLDPDSDNDGLPDGVEVFTTLSDPLVADTDGDGLGDGVEVNTYGTDPTLADGDGDGLTDGEEVLTYFTAPNDVDTDNDGLEDGDEVLLYGSNPNAPDVCKVPQCDANGCVLVQDPDPACCEPTLLSITFDSGSPEGFTFFNSSTESLWQPRTGGQYVSPLSALYYGNPARNDFNDGNTSGTAVSPAVTLPNAEGNVLSFDLWMNTENSTFFDNLTVKAFNPDTGVVTDIWFKSSYIAGGPFSTWRLQTVNLDAFQGQTVKFFWEFKTMDFNANGGEGVYVDNVLVKRLCSCTDVSQCDDGDACTVDVCLGLPGCAHSAVACDDANLCTNDTCAPATGCVFAPNAAPCDDGDTCTHGDSCVGGSCQSGAPAACDDGNPCTADSCDPLAAVAEQCVNAAAPTEGQPCSDSDLCTILDVCVAGACTGQAIGCDDGNFCTFDTCSFDVGCIHISPCDDGDACTFDLCLPDDSCQHVPTGQPACCTTVAYAEAFDGASPGGFDLANTDAATGWSHVLDRLDVTGTGALFYGNPAMGNFDTPGVSNSGTATSPLIAVPTEPGVAVQFSIWMDTDAGLTSDLARLEVVSNGGATAVEVWNKTNYLATGAILTWRRASVDLGPWAGESVKLRWTFDTVDAADNFGGGVYIDHIVVGSPCAGVPCTAGCDDGQPCTVDSCEADLCAHALAQCDDGNVCTFDYCDNAVGCAVAPVEGPCDDGDACTAPDVCDAGSCVGAPVDCDDFQPCTIDSCDPLQGGCVYDSDTLEGQACSDNDVCSLNDTCFSGMCIGEALDCSDGVLCTTDYCDPVEGCSNPPFCDDGTSCTTDICDDTGAEPTCEFLQLPEGAPCDDAYACSTNDVCDASANCIGQELSCEDNNACTFDFCNPELGCVNDLLCDDGFECTVDSCDPQTGCINTFVEGLPCEDGLACTQNDICSFFAGCSGEDTCDDGNPCTIEGCHLWTGECTVFAYESEQAPCDDGDSCTDGDVCDGNGACQPGTAICPP